jgi:cbb3-type cytochrome oxidase subunit 3
MDTALLAQISVIALAVLVVGTFFHLFWKSNKQQKNKA